MKRITLDTNCLYDYFERNSEYLEKLIEFQKEGRIEIAITTRVKVDTYGKNQNSLIWKKIQNFPCITVPTYGRYDCSDFDQDYFADEAANERQTLIQSCIGSTIKKLIDVDHLLGHIINKRDIFVTSDKDDFIKHRDCLQSKFNIKILTPKECIDFLLTML